MLAIGCDNAGLELKKQIILHLNSKGIACKDFGTDTNERTDYPIYGKLVANAVASGEFERGILVCGTGVGMSIVANKVNGIRAAACSEPYSAKLSKQHNDSNILCFGERVVGIELAKMIVDEWLNAEFLGERHKTRVDMIMAIEKNTNEKE